MYGRNILVHRVEFIIIIVRQMSHSGKSPKDMLRSIDKGPLTCNYLNHLYW